MKSQVTYRMVAGPDFEKLARHLSETGQPLPNPLLCVGWIAENEIGEIVGHIVLHSVPILEGLKVTEEHRGSGVGFRLIEKAREFILHSQTKRVLMHTSDERMDRYLKSMIKGITDCEIQYLEWNRPKPQDEAAA
jgi:predicted N-acetyltransferase YhbS